MRRAARKDRDHDEIVEAFTCRGAVATYLREPVDLLVSYRGHWLVGDVKKPLGPRGGGDAAHGQDFSEPQKRWIKKQRAAVHAWRTVADVAEALNRIDREMQGRKS